MMRSSTLFTYGYEERFGQVEGIREFTQDLPMGATR